MTSTNNPAVNELERQIETLNREVGMLRKGQPHLKGIQARFNVARIETRLEMLETLNASLGIIARFGAAEIDRCNQEASRG